MSYTPKHFKLPPKNTLPHTGKNEPYVFDDNIAIAVDIALATGRPLLVAGRSWQWQKPTGGGDGGPDGVELSRLHHDLTNPAGRLDG